MLAGCAKSYTQSTSYGKTHNGTQTFWIAVEFVEIDLQIKSENISGPCTFFGNTLIYLFIQ